MISNGAAHGAETFAANSDITYTFPGTKFTTEKLSMRWTDGNGPSRPDATRAQLPEGAGLPGAGSFLVGEKGVMIIPHWSMPSFYANGAPLAVEIQGRESKNHYHEWSDACRGEGETSTPFSYSAPLTEAVLVGTLAGAMPGQELEWNADGTSLGDPKLDALLGRSYREGWEVAGL